MKERRAPKIILLFSLLAILIMGWSVARSMAQSAPTYDGTRTDVKALETDSTAYQTEDADGAAAIMVDENNEKTAGSNVVYSVVFNYRGYDTLGESFILIGAIVGTTAILRRKHTGLSADEEKDSVSGTSEAAHLYSGAAADSISENTRNPKYRYKKKPVIVRCGADSLMPLGLVYGWYIILHGASSPGGGFQGGVLAASAVMLVYLAYGLSGLQRTFHPKFLHESELAAEIFYVLVALTGVFAGLRFCYNFVFPDGQEESAMLMNDAVGYHVMAGISGLLIIMLGTLERDDMRTDKVKRYHPANEAYVKAGSGAASGRTGEGTAASSVAGACVSTEPAAAGDDHDTDEDIQDASGEEKGAET